MPNFGPPGPTEWQSEGVDPLVHANLHLATERHLDPAIISERLGLRMDHGIALGDVHILENGTERPPSKVTAWVHGSGEFERTFDVQGLLNRFLDTIEPVADELARLRSEFDLAAHITLNIQMDDGVTPDGTLEATTLARLVALDIDLDLDLYTEQ